MKRLTGLLAVLALVACFGRVAALAAPSGDPHACCRGEAAEAPAQSELAECCPVSAVTAFSAPRIELPFVGVVETPSFAAPSAALVVELRSASPPGPQTLRRAVPSRAPPLA